MLKEWIARRRGDRRFKEFYEKYQWAFLPGLLILGFFAHAFTFRVLKFSETFLLLGAHALVVATAIIYTNLYDARHHETANKVLRWLRAAFPVLSQFSLGSLLSTSLVFYWFSGTLSVSWPIILAIAALAASNEVFRSYFLRPAIQIGVFFFSLIAYFSLLFPVLFNSLSAWTFVLASGVSAVLVIGGVLLISRAAPTIRVALTRILTVVLTVFVAMNALYFFNIIPPIPLSIREAGVYYNVRHVGDQYLLTGENESFFQRLVPGQTVYASKSPRIYVYTAIFAPSDIDTTIFHRWQMYDGTRNEWVTKDRLSFAIVGGRDAGYRGYTFKTTVIPGKWRVIVETARGQVLGTVPFVVR